MKQRRRPTTDNPQPAGCLELRLADETLRGRLDDPPTTFGLGTDLVVTDMPAVATSAGQEVVLVASELLVIMRVFLNRVPFGCLHPRDLDEDVLAALARGNRVFSVFSPEDLALERPHYETVMYVARGYTRAEAGALSGYSPKQVSRILKGLADQIYATNDFRWPLLAPLFET